MSDLGRTDSGSFLSEVDDQIFLDLAMAGKATFVVTADRAFLRMSAPEGIRVVSPTALRDALSL